MSTESENSYTPALHHFHMVHVSNERAQNGFTNIARKVWFENCTETSVTLHRQSLPHKFRESNTGRRKMKNKRQQTKLNAQSRVMT